MARKKENVSVVPTKIWGQQIEAVIVQPIPPANQQEADQDYYEEGHYINDSDISFLYVQWQFRTGRYRLEGSKESNGSKFERLNSTEWHTRLGEAMINPNYQLSKINRESLLSVREKVSAITLFLLFFGKNTFRQIIRDAELNKLERDHICQEILFEIPSSAYANERAFVNNLLYSLNRGKF